MLLTDEILKQYGERIVAQLKLDIQNKSISPHGPVNATGALRDSIRYEVSNGTLSVHALGYSYYLQHGREPGKRPPTGVIEKWIKDKGIIPTGITTGSLAYLIARKIGDKGTLIYQQGGSNLLSSVINDQLLSDLKSELLTGITAQVIESFRANVLNNHT